MERRRFLQGTAASALMAVPGGLPAAAVAKRRRPNILYVFDDQHRAQSLPGEPYSPVVAPTLAAFRRANFSMDRCVSNYPLCTPYRGILMTGRWPQQSGLASNNASIRRDEVSIGWVFKDQGYRTAYVGKWHLGHGADFIPAGPDRQGFDDWHVWERTNNHYKSWTYDPVTGARIQPEGWTPVRMTDQAVDIIKRQPKDAPWLMMVSYNPPHPPYNPPEADKRAYDAARLPLRPNVRLSMKGQPGAIAPLADEAALRRAMVGYYGAITGIDAQFARLLAVLDETGQAQDTVVVFTSDHGDMMGSQGRMFKSCPYEESIRVPFMIRYPGVVRAGGRSDTLFGATDIYPTLCGLAGIPVPRHCVGRDLSPVMRGEPLKAPPTHVFLMNAASESDDDGAEAGGARGGRRGGGKRESSPVGAYTVLPPYRGIRTDTHTYAVADSGRWLLFDNVADPFQQKNLVSDPAQRALMDRLDTLIVGWLQATGDAFPLRANVGRIARLPA